MQTNLRQHSGETSTISQLSLNNGATNVDCNGEMANVRDNGATNNNDITITLQRKFYIFGGKKMKLNDHVTNDQREYLKHYYNSTARAVPWQADLI